MKKRRISQLLPMTANAFEEDKREAIAAGMNGHISKPIQVDRLAVDIGRNYRAARLIQLRW